MFEKIRNSPLSKGLAIFFAVLILDIFNPSAALALTGGPSQPEVQSFEPIGTSEMVNLFSGDFTYNIPLMDVGGYPVNMHYNSGITMDQEASWVGLGWNLNSGAITRQLRGLPDDFNGDLVTKEFNLKPNETYTATGGPSLEIFGDENADLTGSLALTLGISYNNYNGVGVSTSIRPTMSFSKTGSTRMTAGLGISSGPDGLALSPSVSMDARMKGEDEKASSIGVGAGISYNSRGGLSALTLNYSVKQEKEVTNSEGENSYQGLYGVGGGSAISLGGATYVPSITMPMHSFSISANAKFAGGAFFGSNLAWGLGGSYSKNELKSKSIERMAYGYNNHHNAQNHYESLMDFNREKDIPYSRRVPALPVTNLTYDMYSIAGQGIAGSYRAYRGDAGYVYDPRSTNESASGSLGVEIGGGGLLHTGLDVTINDVNSTSGKWTAYNIAANKIQYRTSSGDADYEPYYFKQTGEKSVESDPSFVNSIHGDKAIRIDIESGGGFESKTNGRYASKNAYTSDMGAIVKPVRDERQRRSLSISKLKRSEADIVGLDPDLYTTAIPGHHNAEFTITKPDGSRYVYGLPLYNTTQKEVSFNASGNIVNCATGLVPYSGNDNTSSNSRGQDNFYSSMTLPRYAHSYMLTAVLSADYSDLTGNGPSEDDLGTYTLFEYDDDGDNDDTDIDSYKWRTPYQEDQAYYAEGYKSLKGNNGDDRGSYVYGEKDIKYLSRIRTKTHVAEFSVSKRKDAYEVIDENGGIGTNPLHKLDQIDLYAAPDYNANFAGGTAVPIKSVHFVYSYDLCDEIPNNIVKKAGGDPDAGGYPKGNTLSNAGGKLTLKKVYFTYKNSNKGMLSPYEFDYSTDNPNYNIKAYDRWGHYKPNNCSGLTNSEFPYVDQTLSQSTLDSYAESWSMTKITLPSGGEIDIEYEADDYAFVQDRRAYQMFQIIGIGDGGNSPQPVPLYDIGGPNTRIFFTVPSSITNAGELYDNCLKDIVENDDGFMYFNFLVDIKGSGSHEEFVRGYCKINSTPTFYGVNGTTGYVDVKLIGGDHPIAKAAWQFGRLNIPRVVYNQPATSNGVLNTIISFATVGTTMISQINEMFQGPDGYFEDRGYGADVDVNKSFIRLMNPTGKKYGGGARVKKLTMNDAWHSMADEESTYTGVDYGQNYYYTVDGTPTGESSGVASYEPQIGGDENALKHPEFYGGAAKALAPDDKHYVETPFGECYYPTPSVGYSKVTVQSITGKDEGVERHGTGKTVHEFYTAKDFPTKARRTIKEAIPQKSNPIGQALSFDVKDYMTVSQGYVVELNDMHGKPKAQKVYPEGSSEVISKVEYFYKHAGNELENDVTVINSDGTIQTAEVGVEYEMVADFRQQESHTTSTGAQINLEGFIAGIFPILVPPIWPNYSSQKQRFRSAVNTKIVSRYGILEKTVATDLGSVVETKNLAYDTETGEVLLTETINDYNDPIYSFTYPAHWSYDRMGPAYKNIELDITASAGSITSPYKSIADQNGLLIPGDEILIDGTSKGWIWDNDDSDSNVFMIDEDGAVIDYNTGSPQSLKVVRSGRRNMQTTPMGTIVSLRNPLDNSGSTYKNDASEDAILFASNTATIDPDDWEILNAGVTEFDEDWKSYVSNSGECDPYIDSGQVVNPYILGLRGNWRSKKSWLYLGEREQRDNSPTDNNLDIRNDGLFATFSRFWTPPTGSQTEWNTDETDWTWTMEVSDYGVNGNELENFDALNRYSSAVFGYREKLPILVAKNTQRQNVAYDGFEDYAFKGLDCKNDHFDFDGPISPSSTEAHTGNYSAKVTGGGSVTKTASLSSWSISNSADQIPYTFKAQDVLKLFSPITYNGDKKFIISFWVKEELSLDPEEYNDLITYSSDITIDVVAGTTLTKSNIKKSDIIDGWQKIEYEFTISGSTSGDLDVKLVANSSNNTYFDDVRIQPINSSMKSYVYDDITFRLMAELDENNYATFYEYDNEGALVRVKKETARGIVTIQESRNSKYKPQ